jgi:hypothetical protein
MVSGQVEASMEKSRFGDQAESHESDQINTYMTDRVLQQDSETIGATAGHCLQRLVSELRIIDDGGLLLHTIHDSSHHLRFNSRGIKDLVDTQTYDSHENLLCLQTYNNLFHAKTKFWRGRVTVREYKARNRNLQLTYVALVAPYETALFYSWLAPELKC